MEQLIEKKEKQSVALSRICTPEKNKDMGSVLDDTKSHKSIVDHLPSP